MKMAMAEVYEVATNGEDITTGMDCHWESFAYYIAHRKPTPKEFANPQRTASTQTASAIETMNQGLLAAC